MAKRKSDKSAKKEKTVQTPRSMPGAAKKLVMTTVWLSPHHMSLLDEICSHILRNSSGDYRPSRSEIIRLLVERLPKARRKLKQVRTIEELEKGIEDL